jgi:hypothetical protein
MMMYVVAVVVDVDSEVHTMYHSLDEAAIITISSFTGQRCHVELPSWVGSLAEAILLVREAHSNALVDDTGKAHYHPAIDYLEDTLTGEVIETLEHLRQAREVSIHIKPRATNTSSWMMVSMETAPRSAVSNDGSVAVADADVSSRPIVAASVPRTHIGVSPPRDSVTTPGLSVPPMIAVEQRLRSSSALQLSSGQQGIEHLIRYHQQLRHDVAARHPGVLSAERIASRLDRYEESYRRPAVPTVASPPRDESRRIASVTLTSPSRDAADLPNPNTAAPPLSDLRSTPQIVRLEDDTMYKRKSLRSPSIEAAAQHGDRTAYLPPHRSNRRRSSSPNLLPAGSEDHAATSQELRHHEHVEWNSTSTLPSVDRTRVAPTSPMPDEVGAAPPSQIPSRSGSSASASLHQLNRDRHDALVPGFDEPDALESDEHSVHDAVRGVNDDASLAPVSVTTQHSMVREPIEYSPANSEDDARNRSSTALVGMSPCFTSGAPTEPAGIRATSRAASSPRRDDELGLNTRAVVGSIDEGAEGSPGSTSWPTPTMGARLEVAEINSRRHRSLQHVMSAWGIAPPTSLLFREVICDVAAANGCTPTAIAAESLRDLHLVIEGPSGSGATTTALTVAGDVILSTQQANSTGCSLLVPVQLVSLLEVPVSSDMGDGIAQWLTMVARQWIRASLQALDASLGGASLDVDTLAELALPLPGPPRATFIRRRAGMGASLATALRAACPALSVDQARRAVDAALSGLLRISENVRDVVTDAQRAEGASTLGTPTSSLMDVMLVLASAMQYVPLLFGRLYGWAGVLVLLDGLRGAPHVGTLAFERAPLLMEILRMVLVANDAAPSAYLTVDAIKCTGVVYCRHVEWTEALGSRQRRVPLYSGNCCYDHALLLGGHRIHVLDLVPDAVAVGRYGFPALLRVHRRVPATPPSINLEGCDSDVNQRVDCSLRHYPLRVFLGAPGFLALLYRHVAAAEDASRGSGDWVLPLSGEDADVLCELVDICALTMSPSPLAPHA